MVYISADGKVRDERKPSPFNPLRYLSDAFFSLSLKKKAVVVVCLAIAIKKMKPNPLANGRIPAAFAGPCEHWDIIKNDPTFMRRMTAPLIGTTPVSREIQNQRRHHDMATKQMDLILKRVDFGGYDGHIAEGGAWNDLESVRGTRCSTSQSALTAYYCGAGVASNQDAGLGDNRKMPFLGVKSFANFIACRHEQGQRNGHRHRRSVYRLGIGCEDNLAGYSHAFSIIAQPDGTFLWLQSFISHYSLASWMEKIDKDGSLVGQLALTELQAKLKQVERLMHIFSWDDQANSDYLDLFGVDKEAEAFKRGKSTVASTWKPTHRLDAFYWDEACEYPLPSAASDNSSSSSSNNNNIDDDDNNHEMDDECHVDANKSQLEELLASLKDRL